MDNIDPDDVIYTLRKFAEHHESGELSSISKDELVGAIKKAVKLIEDSDIQWHYSRNN